MWSWSHRKESKRPRAAVSHPVTCRQQTADGGAACRWGGGEPEMEARNSSGVGKRFRARNEKLFWGGKTLPGEKRFGETVERETAVRTCIWCICEIW